MGIDRAKLLATRSDALAAKHAFMSAYGSDLAHCAVGLGVSRDGQEWTLKVYVQDGETDMSLPSQFERFEVDVELTGPISTDLPLSQGGHSP